MKYLYLLLLTPGNVFALDYDANLSIYNSSENRDPVDIINIYVSACEPIKKRVEACAFIEAERQIDRPFSYKYREIGLELRFSTR